MIPYERRAKIKELLSKVDYMKIEQLSEKFPDTSLSTLRRDLKKLSDNSEVQILSGGAVKITTMVGELPFKEKNTLNIEEKEKIAQLAADEIKDGETIYLDAGSTCLYLYKKIFDKNIRIFTTNLDLFTVRCDLKAEIFFLGGQYIQSQSSVNGTFTMQTLEKIYFDRAFLGANGIDTVSGVTTATIEEASKKRLIAKQSSQTYFLCDSTKFNKRANVTILNLENFTIISDKNDKAIGEYVKIIYKKR